MYESITFEDILQRMLNRVPDTMDKREGSIIYDAIAPAAVELQNMYIEFDTILNETFADTAHRSYLVRRAAERGITPQEASAATVKVMSTPTSVDIPIGNRFSLNNLNYRITSKEADGEYHAVCESTGVQANAYVGNLIPIDYIDGLETVAITEILIPGEDEESAESLRARYFNSFDTQAYGGNKADYIERVNAIPGVGSTKVTPVWDGPGTVKLTILNSDFDHASSVLIDTVQEIIDPTRDASGSGVAPIGHIVTVDTASDVTINVHTNITFQEGYSFTGQKTVIENAIKEYLLEIRENWANEDNSVVRISQIETRLLNITGIVDVRDTTINGSAENLTLGTYEVPVFGEVTNA